MDIRVNPNGGQVFVALPQPTQDRDDNVFNAFNLRCTIRDIGCARLPLETLSNLLWSACGINRRRGRSVQPDALRRQRAIRRRSMSTW